MPGRDWLPEGEDDFADLCFKWKAGLSDPVRIAAFGWDPAAAAAVAAAIGGFLDAWETYRKVDSRANRITKDAAKKKARRGMRDFANFSMRYNRLMGDADRWYYGPRPAGGARVPGTAPQTFPEAAADSAVIRQVTIHFWDSETKKRGKPRGIHGAEIRWAILGHAPASVRELTNSDFATATPFTLVFDESDRGKRLYFCLRWKTTANRAGPFGEIYLAVIP
jgi:hypothetical protein